MGVSAGVSSVYIPDVLAPYALNNLEDAEPMYIGKASPDSKWLVQKFSPASGVMTYANSSNNGGTVGYGAAWAARAALVYDRYEVLTGV